MATRTRFSIYYFVAGPHPRELCLRGSRRSALIPPTVRSVNDFVTVVHPPSVPSPLTPLGSNSTDGPFSQRLRHSGSAHRRSLRRFTPLGLIPLTVRSVNTSSTAAPPTVGLFAAHGARLDSTTVRCHGYACQPYLVRQRRSGTDRGRGRTTGDSGPGGGGQPGAPHQTVARKRFAA